MERFRIWAEREYSPRKRIVTIIVAGIFFLFVLPGMIILFAKKIDSTLMLPQFDFAWFNALVGILLILTGGAVAIWTITVQYKYARGTPLPMMATQNLLVDGPFYYCRNPMSLGTIVMYSGIAVWIGFFTALLVVMFLSLILLSYLWKVEEVELVMRFGEEYSNYRDRTPFILPRIHN